MAPRSSFPSLHRSFMASTYSFRSFSHSTNASRDVEVTFGAVTTANISIGARVTLDMSGELAEYLVSLVTGVETPFESLAAAVVVSSLECHAVVVFPVCSPETTNYYRILCSGS
ncbi:hypothetical protein ON010_g4103 [Phytophthora cinnamomi]|nr:hypothetical protein ON010_g4103 [Phytophthora cinnamomi]